LPNPNEARPWILVACALAAAAAILCPPARAGVERVSVRKTSIRVDDGDSISIRWGPGRDEQVRILCIDAPEVLHLEHDIPYSQPFGEKATGFLMGCLAAADEVELLRSGQTDGFGRTLGYLFVDGKNYSVLAIRARMAVGPSGRFGDNGLPDEYRQCRRAAADAGPVPFQLPRYYRKRMRAVAAFMKTQGTYPVQPAARGR
jgi:endonuclease YncB( thermonuclease family)